MACFHPVKAYRGPPDPHTGKLTIHFNSHSGYRDRPPILLPCNGCLGCRMDRSRQWAVRCMHEAQMYKSNSFVTLTYNEEHLPAGGSLSPRHHQLFMKRLRKKSGRAIRFYACGEYGPKLTRPHYHYLFFNFDPPDKKPHHKNRNGEILYSSKFLDEIWGKGYTMTGAVTLQSAAYVARYINKKITGDAAEQHYKTSDPITGEIYQLEPEFSRQSNKPGIGKKWYDKFHKTDVENDDFIIHEGKKMRPPRFYDKQFEKKDPKKHFRTKIKRKISSRKNAANNTPERLAVREKVLMAKTKNLKRNMEQNDE